MRLEQYENEAIEDWNGDYSYVQFRGRNLNSYNSCNFAIPRIGEEAVAEPLWKGGTQPLGVSHNPVIEEP